MNRRTALLALVALPAFAPPAEAATVLEGNLFGRAAPDCPAESLLGTILGARADAGGWTVHVTLVNTAHPCGGQLGGTTVFRGAFNPERAGCIASLVVAGVPPPQILCLSGPTCSVWSCNAVVFSFTICPQQGPCAFGVVTGFLV